MIVCHCTGATDREIRRAARLGGSAGEAGRRCGGCCAEVTRLINLEKSGQAPAKQPGQPTHRHAEAAQRPQRRDS